MRVRVDGTPAQRARALTALEQAVADQAQVSTDTRTGSALVVYDPRRFNVHTLVEILREVDEIFADLEAPSLAGLQDRGASDAAQAVHRGFSQANVSTLRATGGRMDLRMLFPVVLGGLAVGQLLRRRGGLGSAPWYVMAYYAFDSYVKLHAADVRTEKT